MRKYSPYREAYLGYGPIDSWSDATPAAIPNNVLASLFLEALDYNYSIDARPSDRSTTKNVTTVHPHPCPPPYRDSQSVRHSAVAEWQAELVDCSSASFADCLASIESPSQYATTVHHRRHQCAIDYSMMLSLRRLFESMTMEAVFVWTKVSMHIYCDGQHFYAMMANRDFVGHLDRIGNRKFAINVVSDFRQTFHWLFVVWCVISVTKKNTIQMCR